MKSLTDVMHDGRKFYTAIQERLGKLDAEKDMNFLLFTAGLDYSTGWRWSQGSKPEIDSVRRVEKVLNKWERDQSSAPIPSARQ